MHFQDVNSTAQTIRVGLQKQRGDNENAPETRSVRAAARRQLPYAWDNCDSSLAYRWLLATVTELNFSGICPIPLLASSSPSSIGFAAFNNVQILPFQNL